MGHVMRCLNIAGALKASGVEVRFYTNSEDGPARPVEEAVRERGFGHSLLEFDASSIDSIAEDMAIIDTQKDIRRHAASLKEAGKRVVLIDNYSASDLADRVIVPYAVRGGRPVEKNFLFGPDYVIAGDNFLMTRDLVPAPRYSHPLRVLVTMGGADPNNLTEMAVEALLVLKDIEVTVVMGPASRNDGKIERIISSDTDRFRVLRSVKDMAPLMRRSHIAITALGMTVYELSLMGVPSIIIGNYPRDRAYIAELERLGVLMGLGFYRDVNAFRIGKSVQFFLRDRLRWEAMSERASSLTDGLGARRIAGEAAALLGCHGGERDLFGPCSGLTVTHEGVPADADEDRGFMRSRGA